MAARSTIFSLHLVVVDKPGVLARVALVFSRCGYNIASLVVSPGSSPGFSGIDLSYLGKEDSLAGIKRQLEKLVDVIEVEAPPA